MQPLTWAVLSYGIYIVHKLVLLALVDFAVQPEMGTELQGLQHRQGGSVDVILLHIPHHTSQGGLGLGLPVQPLLARHPAS